MGSGASVLVATQVNNHMKIEYMVYVFFYQQVETAKKTGVLVFTNRGFQDIPEQVSFADNRSKVE